MADNEPQPTKGGIKLDFTINVTHVFMFVSFVGSLMVSWNLQDKRILVLEEAAKRQEQVDRHQDTIVNQHIVQIRETLTDVKREMRSLNEKLVRP